MHTYLEAVQELRGVVQVYRLSPNHDKAVELSKNSHPCPTCNRLVGGTSPSSSWDPVIPLQCNHNWRTQHLN